MKALAVEIEVEFVGSNNRSDSNIARTAENVLEWTTNWPKDHVKVMVENGWVTLTGVLDYAFQKKASSSAIRNLMGVNGLSD